MTEAYKIQAVVSTMTPQFLWITWLMETKQKINHASIDSQEIIKRES